MHELWIHPTESLICYHVTNSLGYQTQQRRHVECVTLTLLPFNSLKQDFLCPLFSSYIPYSMYMDQLKEHQVISSYSLQQEETWLPRLY